jgi:hypothetical protein
MANPLTSGALVRPGFADHPPLRLNVNARVLGLVMTVVGIAAIVLCVRFVAGVAGLCNGLSLCTFPTVDELGNVVLTLGWLVATVGFVLLATSAPSGPSWAVYGLLVVVVGDILSLVGDVIFVSANSLYYGIGPGAIVIFVFWLVVPVVAYYLVVISRAAAPSDLTP